MYEGDLGYREYCNWLDKRKKRKKRRKCAFVLMLAACVGVLSLFLLYNAWNIHVSAGQEKAATETINIVMEDNASEYIASEPVVVEPAEAPETLLAGTAEEVKAEPIIFIDAGHGGEDEGCAREGVREKDINLSIAALVQEKLENMGYQVVMAREEDIYIAKEDRVKQANSIQADIYVSIHQNASDETDVSGMEVWYQETDERDNKRLAQLVCQQTAKSTGALERELRGDADFHVTGKTTMPACLIETGFLSNAQERTMLTTPEYQEQIADGIVQGIDYYFHPKTMYLTFDDGPTEENTNRVLDILKERDIKATFFLVGENVKKHPEVAKRIVAEGHTIGIHCNNHDYEVIYASADSYVQDFETARQIVYEVTGVETNIFRFPGGSINHYNQNVYDEIIEKMTEKGYIYYDWNASLEDAVQKSEPQQLVQNGLSSTLGRKKVIMLAHDVVYNTGICLNDLLDGLPEYEMKPLSETVEPIQF